MLTLFAMAGIAGAAWCVDIAILEVSAYFVAFLAIIGVFTRLPLVAGVDFLLIVISALLFSPWDAYFQKPNEDPDWLSIMHSWQLAARTWFALMGLSFFLNLITMFRGRHPGYRDETPKGTSMPLAMKNSQIIGSAIRADLTGRNKQDEGSAL